MPSITRRLPLLTSVARSFDLSGLIAYWRLSDVTDSSGNGRTLTNNNSVAFSAGKVGNCASFVSASNQFLGIADNADFSIQSEGGFTVGCWVCATSWSPHTGIVSKANGGSSNSLEWVLRVDGSYRALSNISNGVTDSYVVNTNFGALAADTWYFLVLRHDPVANLNRIRVNTTDQTGAWSSNSWDSSFGVAIGSSTIAGSAFFNGKIDEVFIFSRHLSDDELLLLYNNGEGRRLF